MLMSVVMTGSKRLGRAIHARRMHLGQSRETVGKIVGGVSKTTVGRWEDARTLPGPDNAEPLAAWLDMPIEHVSAMMRNEEPEGLRDGDLRVEVQALHARLAANEEAMQELTTKVIELTERYARMADAAIESMRRRGR